jgi:predicted secreted protein
MQRVLLVAHCILNISSKVILYEEDEKKAEESLRRKFLQKAIDGGIQLLQLPCPEFTLYGADRWGHVSNQFDNPFFRSHCRELLEPVLQQVEEYLAHPDRFEVLGVLGVDGSPSCGVDYSCKGQWKGSFGGRSDLDETLSSARCVKGRGIMIDELAQMLQERGLSEQVPLIGLYAKEPDKCLCLI